MTEPTCAVTAKGYRCDRGAGHGMLHHDPRPSWLHGGLGTWWIQEPWTEDEAMGRAPMTGYVLVNDRLLWSALDALHERVVDGGAGAQGVAGAGECGGDDQLEGDGAG